MELLCGWEMVLVGGFGMKVGGGLEVELKAVLGEATGVLW